MNSQKWTEKFPLLRRVAAAEEIIWLNPSFSPFHSVHRTSIRESIVEESEKRFLRFKPWMQEVFSIDEPYQSPLTEVRKLQHVLQIPGRLFIKQDSELPVAGSIKARGGFHEVFAWAEQLALKHHLLTGWSDDYRRLNTPEAKALFSSYTIAVGSTGNLGMSIGIMGTSFGFQSTVHMSNDAKKWKKDRLRNSGARVLEYTGDYSRAVEEGRRQCLKDETCHFVDDERSTLLFAGYTTAASELAVQLRQAGLYPDENHPLFVYLPCGVGGGPGGVAFGLKRLFGKHVHCFFAEPTHSPAMLLGLVTREHEKICVQDLGLDNQTEADGLAVGRPSALASKVMEPLLSGAYTIEDDRLYEYLDLLMNTEQFYLEPSALAGMAGPEKTAASGYFEKYAIDPGTVTHVVWGTGGGLVPEDIRAEDRRKRKSPKEFQNEAD
ncbi:D-serine ammonia-lyase [Sinobaca qinghaiensis]|uniref:Probable D-serine dehydratase n=1 Tax=Sinobaca qinghaiensis TaxID=342944 RepID=A0A419V4U9_9BACL|nr:D-serine ammonia-lyase [Sinobaca qinghaiensis]RKD73515.1 D-serine ammonia-lyase [Sinobaca qinghaiensis]